MCIRDRGSLPATVFIKGNFYFHISLRNGSMVMAKKIVFEIIADSDSTTLKTYSTVTRVFTRPIGLSLIHI